jgi:glutamate synthase (NADPH/NADH) large chain
MGISTIMSYRGAQIFGAVGLSQETVDKYFTGTTSKLGGVGLAEIERETTERHLIAYPDNPSSQPYRKLRTGGEYKWRKSGEEHLFDPEAIFHLQHSTSHDDYQEFKQYSTRINDNSKRLMTLRALLQFKSDRQPIDLSEVEPAEDIMTRFSTGAMSYGSISLEAHETMARAMNMINARSNSGEGGEEIERLHDPALNSKIKQVASGRFGVTDEYLVSATDLQIKLAQGAKPGEGGHLPGAKVYSWIAHVRHSTPGIDLVSPPPHHDIYSIEDLAQLIHDLKMANPEARVHGTLVAEYGVGTIAAGVSKAHADVVLISGHDGGTGAAPLSSIKHAGQPWEIGLAETHQTLVQNDLRDRIVVQCDGQLKTGRDVVIAALLGAEEFGFATAPLVTMGCVMMRVCNKNTCPVGVATQDPFLRKNFRGKPEYVVNYFKFVAEEVREIIAQLGYKTLDELVGQSQLLDQREVNQHYKAAGLDMAPILARPKNSLRDDAPLVQTKLQKHGLEKSLDAKLIPQIDFEALNTQAQVIDAEITNVDRTFGTLIAYEVTKRYQGDNVLPKGQLQFNLSGVGGQSLGAFIPQGVEIRLTGETNDYAAKGLSGGKLVVKAPENSKFDVHKSIIAGNVLGFGATSGEAYFEGVVGERFAVRNSGATLVSEGTGDHALEYMTGGRVVILGSTGKNLGAGFLGGIAYVLDLDQDKVNTASDLEFATLDTLEDGIQDEVCAILEDYTKETGSTFANQLLNNWQAVLSRITRIIPRKFRLISEIADPAANWDDVMQIVNS